MILEIDDEELTWLKSLAGGPYDQSSRTLGKGMSGEKVLRFRAKLHELKPPRIYNPSAQSDGQ